MNVRKTIICISCGKSFFVDREEYEERKVDCLCDKCRGVLEEVENANNDDVISSVGEAARRVATNLGGKIAEILKTNKEKDDYNE